MKKLTTALLAVALAGSAFMIIPRKTSRPLTVYNRMNEEDRYYLATFLRITLFCDDFAYLLFGSKPIAITNFSKSLPFKYTYEFVSKLNFEINKGLEIFKKNQHLFSSSNIIVHLEEDDDYSYLFMINKKNLLKTLNEHIEDFKLVLGPKTTTESLFIQITENIGKDAFFKAIGQHEASLGILLGYGRNNAWLFHQKKTLLLKLNTLKPPLKWDSSLEKAFAQIIQKTSSFCQEPPVWRYLLITPRIHLPHFMADPNSLETKKLKERYEKERVDIKKLFAKQDYVEATLQRLTEN